MRTRHFSLFLSVLALAAVVIVDPVHATDLSALREARRSAIEDRMRSRNAGSTLHEDAPAVDGGPHHGGAPVARADQVVSMPTNVQHNNKAGDSPSITQSQNSIAMDGSFGIASWNDGIGGASGMQGLAYTTNGGVSWTDIGGLPTNATVTTWSGSPACAVNPVTHEFYVMGTAGGLQQVAMCRITFPNGAYVISAPILVRQRSGSDLLDQPWLAVDPATGNLYASWTNFVGGTTSRIEFARSPGGATSWEAPQVLSAPAADGLVEAGRPQVGPTGQVHVVWHEIGLTDADFARIRTSSTQGSSFGPQHTALTYFTNFGSGSPGFNRLRSVDTPSLAVDGSSGPHRGRIYVAVNESVDWFSDALGTAGSRSEIETNNTTASATSFTPGQQLRGSIAIASPSPDYWSFTAVQGSSYVFVVDSLATMFYTMRIFCTDGATSLAQSGDNTGCPGNASALVWTAPANGTYYLRMATVSGTASGCPANTAGGYRIQTGIHTGSGSEIARDHRDVVVAWSDDGTTWSQARVNDDPGMLDDFLPEIQVAGDGFPYVMWLDWRDALAINCGGSSATYVTRSTDGGVSWAPSQRIASALTNWNLALGNLTPNQGDHLGMHASGASSTLALSWADGRLGDIDEFGATVSTGLAFTDCPASVAVVAKAGGTVLPLTATIENRNVLFGNTCSTLVTNSRGWSSTIAPTVTVDAGGSIGVPFSLLVPDTAKAGPAQACVILNVGGADAETCCVAITVDRPVATLATVVSASGFADRAEIEWWVATAAEVYVQRTGDGTLWETLESAFPDGTGRIRTRDPGVISGRRYGYRLMVPEAGARTVAGEVWVDIPSTGALSLAPIRNPVSASGLAIRFSLPSAASATLEIVDPHGRRIHHEEVGTMGAGTHTLSVTPSKRAIGEGVYLVRLTQDGRSVTRKITILD